MENGIWLCRFCHILAHKHILRQKLLWQIKAQMRSPLFPLLPWLQDRPATADSLWERLDVLHSSDVSIGKRLSSLDALISEAWHLRSDSLRIEFWALALLDKANVLSDMSRELFDSKRVTRAIVLRRRRAAIHVAAGAAYLARRQGRYDLVARAMHARAASHNAIAEHVPRRYDTALVDYRESRKALEAGDSLSFKRSSDDSTHYARILREAAVTKARLGRGRNIKKDLERSRELERENSEHEFCDASIRLAEGLVREDELGKAEKVLFDIESVLKAQTPMVNVLFLKAKGLLLSKAGDSGGASRALDDSLALARQHEIFHEEHQLCRMKEQVIGGR